MFSLSVLCVATILNESLSMTRCAGMPPSKKPMKAIKFISFFSVVSTIVYLAIAPALAVAQLAEVFYRDRVDESRQTDKINLSHYVYHDRNRNGDYDLGDIPASSIFVLAHKDGRIHAQSETNENGYANFVTSIYPNSEKPDIYEPGEYDFEVLAPSGWSVTSGNVRQSVSIVENQQRRSGLYLADYIKPVGIAQDTWVSGKLAAELARHNSSQMIEVYQAGKLLVRKQMEDDGRFKFDLPPGEYELRAKQFRRAISLGMFPMYVGELGSIEPEAGKLKASDLLIGTFEDLSQIDLYKIPNGYLGLNWKDTNIIRRDFGSLSNQGYANGIVSGDYVAYSSQSRSIEISDSEGFDLESVYLSQAWAKAQGQLVEVRAYRSEEQVLLDRIKLSYLGPIEYSPALANINRVVFDPLSSWQLVMEDLTIRQKNAD